MGLIPNLESTSGGCVIGKIQVGEKKPTDKFPKSLEYFVANSPYQSQFKEAYGDCPTQIEIMFTKDEKNIDEVLTLVNKSNGKQVFETRDGLFLSKNSNESKYYITPKGHPCVVISKAFFVWEKDVWTQYTLQDVTGWTELTCKHSLILRFRIPKITLIDGLWEYRTSAVSSREPIKAVLLEAQTQYWDFIDKIPFDMNVRISKGNAMDRKFPVVNIVMNLNKAEQLQANTFRPVANAALLLGGSNQLQLKENETIHEPQVETFDYADELENAIANER